MRAARSSPRGQQRKRSSRSPGRRSECLSRRAAKAAWNWCLRHGGGARTVDRFGGVTSFDQLYAAQKLPRGATTYELMTHPGNPDYDRDTGILAGPQLPPWLAGGALCSYRALELPRGS